MRNPIKLVKQIRYGSGRYSDTVICDRNFFFITGYGNLNAVTGVFDCIVNQIIQYVRQMCLVCFYRNIFIHFYIDCYLLFASHALGDSDFLYKRPQ